MHLEKLIIHLGFSLNEAKVYLAALETGVESAQNIAEKAGLQRTTTYSVLNRLVQKGVIGKTKSRGKFRYVAESPDKLKSLLGHMQLKLRRALPELEAIYNKSEKKPRVLFYEGDEAIQNVYDDTLRECPPEILEWNTDAYFDNPKVDQSYIAKRVALGIQAKRIAGSGSRWDKRHKSLDSRELSETRVVDHAKFWPGIEVNIYNDKIAFLNYEENNSVIIQSKAIADAMKQVYWLSWESGRDQSEQDE